MYDTLSNQTPRGWTEEAVSRAMSLGYTRFAIHQLQPSPEFWSLAMLLQSRDQQRPEALDPFMIIKQSDVIYGKCSDIIGQIITPALQAKRDQFLSVEKGKKSAAIQTKTHVSTNPLP